MELGVLESSGLTATMIAIILVLYRILKTMDGRRIRSTCCGFNADLGFQTSQMSPIVVVHNPNQNPDLTIRTAQNNL